MWSTIKHTHRSTSLQSALIINDSDVFDWWHLQSPLELHSSITIDPLTTELVDAKVNCDTSNWSDTLSIAVADSNSNLLNDPSLCTVVSAYRLLYIGSISRLSRLYLQAIDYYAHVAFEVHGLQLTYSGNSLSTIESCCELTSQQQDEYIRLIQLSTTISVLVVRRLSFYSLHLRACGDCDIVEGESTIESHTIQQSRVGR